MKLHELLCGIPGIDFSGAEDLEIRGIQYDSRKVQPGDLFIAITGFETDGHRYIPQAVENGAVCVVAEREVPCDVPLIRTENSRIALAVSAANFFENPSKQFKLIGVTGTNGKTTVTYLLKTILEAEGKLCGLIGTNQNMIGDRVLPTERTTPESFELQALFSDMANAGVDYVIMEVSSHSLALCRVYGLEFEVGIFTNLTQDHLDFHKTMENYLAEKAKLFSMCRFGVVNYDDSSYSYLKETASAALSSYGTESGADFRAENVILSAKGVSFSLSMNGNTQEFSLAIPGMFSVYNALAAISGAQALGVSSEAIRNGLLLAESVKGRAEVVPTDTDYTVMIDYAHTPDGLENIISTVRGFAKGRVVTLFGCGGDRDKTKRPQMGAIAAKLSDYCIVTSDNPRTEEPEAIIRDITEGMKGYEERYHVVVNRKDAISYALSHLKADDVLILAGKGHETYQILGKEKIHFDEREVVREILNGKKETTC